MPEYFFRICTITALAGLVVGCENYEYCPSGQSWCWAECVDLMHEEDNCGACDNACEPGQPCIDGRCECPAGYSACDGQCVNLNYDNENCGACGHECSPDRPCMMGVCGGSDCGDCEDMGLMCCDTICVDPMSDEAHCGACYHACRADQFCDNGTCSCIGSMQECDGKCVDLQTDDENCGACRNSCGEWMTCCGGSCTDLQTDDSNCGRCGDACLEYSFCVDGTCSEPCGGAWCDGECVDLEVSNLHCGRCNNPCDVPSGFICQEGVCDCEPHLDDCNGVCVNLDQDEMNCGSCGVICPPAYVCLDGICGGDPIEPFELTCPDSEMPMGASMQCTAFLHPIGGPPIDITEVAEWYWYECEAADGCADGPMIEDVVNGLVSTVDSGGTIGDMAAIYAEYQTYTSNHWSIRLIQ